MRKRRVKILDRDATYHCMTRTVNGARLFGDREKEVLRKMLWRVADFSGVEVLTYCLMSNHFHVLVRVPFRIEITDEELMRRWRVLYPKPTKYESVTATAMEACLKEGDAEAERLRRRLLERMGDVSAFMKTLKQRFSVWFNRTHHRYGTLWSERFKSVLVEGRGNPLQTMAAYIDLNPVRAGLVKDPKDYRFSGYGEAVAGAFLARLGLMAVWADRVGGGSGERDPYGAALRAHRKLIYAKGSSDGAGSPISQTEALKVLEQEDGVLPKAAILRCRVRYFSDGVILGSEAFVRSFVDSWQADQGRKYPPKVNHLRGSDWGDLAVIQSLRRQIFGKGED